MKAISIVVAVVLSFGAMAEEGTYQEVLEGANSVTGVYKVTECADKDQPAEIKVKTKEETYRKLGKKKKRVAMTFDMGEEALEYRLKQFGEDKSLRTFSRNGASCRMGSTKTIFSSNKRYTTVEYVQKSMRYTLCFIPSGKKKYLEQKLQFKKSRRDPIRLTVESKTSKKGEATKCTYEKVADLEVPTVDNTPACHYVERGVCVPKA